VQVEGAWDGAVVLACPQELATKLAAAMFDSAGEPSPSDVQDALGEITNMLAGNIKALLPHPSRITLPVVAFGSDYQLAMLGTHIRAEVTFSSQGESFVVSVLQQSRGGDGS
jgi:chemotaxis protein CheX